MVLVAAGENIDRFEQLRIDFFSQLMNFSSKNMSGLVENDYVLLVGLIQLFSQKGRHLLLYIL